MKPQVYLLATASVITLMMMGASSLQAASQQMFRNQTARVGMMTTMKLLHFRTRPVGQTAPLTQLVTVSSPSITTLSSHPTLGENRHFSLGNSLNQVGQITDALLTLKKLSAQDRLASSQPMAFVLTETQLRSAQGLTWMDTASGTLQHQDYQVQPLQLELPQAQKPISPLSRSTVDVTTRLQLSKEFKPFLNSPKMADQ